MLIFYSTFIVLENKRRLADTDYKVDTIDVKKKINWIIFKEKMLGVVKKFFDDPDTHSNRFGKSAL